jgi:hypothetical protein
MYGIDFDCGKQSTGEVIRLPKINAIAGLQERAQVVRETESDSGLGIGDFIDVGARAAIVFRAGSMDQRFERGVHCRGWLVGG